MKNIRNLLFIIVLVGVGMLTSAAAQTFDRAEYQVRRSKVFDRIGKDGVAIILANERHRYPVKFRQSPDFYYLTGIEEPDAILFLTGATRRAVVFARRGQEWESIVEGPNLFSTKNAAAFYGITAVVGLDEFNEMAAGRLSQTARIFVQMSAPDDLQMARSEMAFGEAIQLSHPLAPALQRHKLAIRKLQEWQPQAKFEDIGPILDELRVVKSTYEIERMRRAGAIGAEGVKEAIMATKPGMFEYELEAAARFTYQKMGARGDAFTPIVASGPNTVVLHYSKNDRKMNAGDVVLMDYGADFDYYTSDITRTWPVSGRFTPEQEKMYRCILEARDAIIAAMKPGVTLESLQEIAAGVYNKHGFGKVFEENGRYIGHFVGISVHDVGDESKPLVAGMTYNVEPLIEDRKLGVHMRLEDSVLITANGAENMTAGVPASLEEIYKLIGSKK